MTNGGVAARKVGLVGTGLVGSSFAYGLMIRGTAAELALVDANNDKAVGEMMDFNHGLSFVRPMKIAAGGYEDLKWCATIPAASSS
jgi:L-lactate dehydrogenase